MTTTPTYQGQAAPAADGGILGALMALLGGGGTPAYAGTGQPAPNAGGFLGQSTPAYQPAPTPSPTPTPEPAPCATDAGPTFGPETIAIVIPRGPQ